LVQLRIAPQNPKTPKPQKYELSLIRENVRISLK